ncbi:MAG: NAD+ synthase [Marinilabiliales bacterium]|nr:MAG: NAD+ synthase [Marinilabiliales bacterium]
MKIALAQINTHTGHFEKNRNKILENIQKAKDNQADLVVFPELSISGYPPRDFLDFDDFTEQCIKEVETIAGASEGISVIVGSPVFNNNESGKMLYNAAILIQDGKIVQEFHKALLPNYDVFDEYRYFEPGREFSLANINNKKVAVTVCEDLWNIDGQALYIKDPMDVLGPQNPDFIINIAASPFSYTQRDRRREVLAWHAGNQKVPVVYVNKCGAQTELIFDGGSMVMMPDGKTSVEMKYFDEDFCIFDTENPASDCVAKPFVKMEAIYSALVIGVREYFEKIGFTKAVLGLSGGIDSALVSVIAAEALGAENVMNILLPSGFSSDHSVNDALELCKNLGSPHEIINIEDGFQTTLKTLKPQFGDLPFNVAEENIQARLRAVILMAYSNKFGNILLNTSNKSEAAVGYGTLYGDMAGALSVIGDLYKTEVYELAHYINRDKEIIPNHIITKAPSAELRPNQKDSDSLPDYEILDKILHAYIEQILAPQEIIDLGYDEALVRRVLKMVNINEYKRFQAPPVLRVSPKSFGMGRRMPLVAKYLA